MGDIDMASALDLPVDKATEAKFQALKRLQALKIQALMESINAQQKEIGKLKDLGKDTMRVRIQTALKERIKDLELLIEYLKDELIAKEKAAAEKEGETVNMEELKKIVNDKVILKTCGGPLRFRPKTREELENRILELEEESRQNAKKMARLDKKNKSNGKPSSDDQSIRSAVSSRSKSNNNNRSISSAKPSGVDNESLAPSQKVSLSLDLKARFSEEVASLRSQLDERFKMNQELTREKARLRSRNAELCALDEKVELIERDMRDVIFSRDRLAEDLAEANSSLARYREECIQIKADTDMVIDSQHLEIEALLEQSERLQKQNSSLLRKMAQLEAETIESTTSTTNKISDGGKGTDATAGGMKESPGKTRDSILEGKLFSLREKLAESEARGETFLKKNDSMVQLLREKNETIRDLQRNIATIAKTSGKPSQMQQPSPTKQSTSSTVPPTSEEEKGTLKGPDTADIVREKDQLIASLYTEISRLNERLERLSSAPNATSAQTRKAVTIQSESLAQEQASERAAKEGETSIKAEKSASKDDDKFSLQAKIATLTKQLRQSEQDSKSLLDENNRLRSKSQSAATAASTVNGPSSSLSADSKKKSEFHEALLRTCISVLQDVNERIGSMSEEAHDHCEVLLAVAQDIIRKKNTDLDPSNLLSLETALRNVRDLSDDFRGGSSPFGLSTSQESVAFR